MRYCGLTKLVLLKLNWLNHINMKFSTISKITLILLAIEAASFLSWQFPVLGVLFWILVVGLTFGVALVRMDLGLGIVMAELVLGGKGYLFSLPVNSFDLSIRIGIFLAVFAAWLIQVIKARNFWGSQFNFRWLWLGFGGIVAWAILIGILRGNGLSPVFFDANAFLFLGLAPAFGKLRTRREFFSLITFIFAAIIVLAIKTGLTQGLFNHIPSTSLVNCYKWIRDTGVGEITYIIGRLYRVFFQSQVYGLLGFFLGIGLAIARPKQRWLSTIIAGLSVFVVIVSLSRSFWLGGGVALGLGFLAIVFWPAIRSNLGKIFLHSSIAFLIGFLLFFWVLNFPYLWGGGVKVGSLVRSRANIQTESAASSRKELLPVIDKAIFNHPILGSGFGAALTYKTKDPRVNQADTPGGVNYTTTAFELGYHAFAMQFGLPLFIAFLILLISILKKGLRLLRLENANGAIVGGLLLSLIAVFTLHLTTPYLNHPLGLGFILISLCAFAILDPRYAEK